eukprot:435179_1
MNFTTRDLALLLPNESGDAVSLRHTTHASELVEKVDTLVPKTDPSKKVLRYRPGQAPSWAQDEADGEADFMTVGHKAKTSNAGPSKPTFSFSSKVERLKEEEEEEEVESERGDGGMRRRRARAQVMGRGKAIEAEVIELGEGKQHGLKIKEEEESSAENVGEEEDEGQARRERARTKMKAKRELEEMHKHEILASEESTKAGILDGKESQGSEGEEESDEWETATESENEDGDEILLRPTFVPREKRQQQEGLLGAAAKVAGKYLETDDDSEKVQRLERHREAQNLVANVIRREEEEEREAMERAKEEGIFADMPTGAIVEDDPDDKLELESWKIRELQRIKRDREERLELEREKSETLRRRNLTNAERRKEDDALGKNKKNERKKMAFMQRYHHKGAFYMDDDSLKDPNDPRLRDTSEATGADIFNKAALPAPMQVRGDKFGKMGQSKWTHLAVEDTTDRTVPSQRPAHVVLNKTRKRIARVGDLDEPFKRRKDKK